MVENVKIADNSEDKCIHMFFKHCLKFLALIILLACFFALISSVSAANFNSSSSSSDIQNFLDSGLGDDEVVLEQGDYVDNLYNLNVSRKVNIKSNGQVNIKSTTGGILFNITARDVKIFNLNISGYQTAIHSNNGGLSIIGNNITTENISITINGSGDLSGISLENNTIISSASNLSGAIYVNANSSSTVGASLKNNNVISNAPYDSYGVFFEVKYCDNSLFFENNNITASLVAAVFNLAYSSINNVTFINNNITATKDYGLFLYACDSNNNITFINNNITGSSMDGVFLGVYRSNNTIILTNNNIKSVGGNGLNFGVSNSNNIVDNILISGNNINATNTGIFFSGNGLVGLTVNYNSILANVGLNFTNVNNGNSNFDYNWWGINDISDKIFGFTTNNHYILNITNLTSLANVKFGDNINFALLVLNTTLTNDGVENLPYFVINGTFNSVNYNTTRDDLFLYEFVVPTGGVQFIDASLNDQYAVLTFSASKLNVNSSIIVPDDARTGKTTTISGVLKEKGNLVANTKITVTINGKQYSVVTDSMGRWSVNYKPVSIGTFDVSVSWDGDYKYFGFSNVSSFNVKKGNININISVAENPDGSVTITANVTDEDNDPLADFPVDFNLNGKSVGSNNTNKNGVASITIPTNKLNNGKNTITVKVSGGSNFNESVGSIEFAVSNNGDESSNNLAASAVMKKTGMPIVILFVLAIFGLLACRRRK